MDDGHSVNVGPMYTSMKWTVVTGASSSSFSSIVVHDGYGPENTVQSISIIGAPRMCIVCSCISCIGAAVGVNKNDVQIPFRNDGSSVIIDLSKSNVRINDAYTIVINY